MAFEVETGSGSATANSLASTAAATAHWAEEGEPASWSVATLIDKQQALVRATRRVTNDLRERWPGTIKTSTQALPWPRNGAYNAEGHAFPSTIVPTEVQAAVIVLASKALDDDITPDIPAGGNIKRISQGVGPLKKDVEYAGTKAGSLKRYPEVWSYLAGILYSANTVERG